MKEMLEKAWTKVVENREIVIRVGCAVAGAVIGGVVTAAVINAQADNYLLEEMTTSIETTVD